MSSAAKSPDSLGAFLLVSGGLPTAMSDASLCKIFLVQEYQSNWIGKAPISQCRRTGNLSLHLRARIFDASASTSTIAT